MVKVPFRQVVKSVTVVAPNGGEPPIYENVTVS